MASKPSPPSLAQMRMQAAAAQSRKNAIGGLIVFSFVASVFAYSILAVGSEDNAITDRDVAEFRAQRERERAQERKQR